nr:unnamed protein product [Digitaria exilis]
MSLDCPPRLLRRLFGALTSPPHLPTPVELPVSLSLLSPCRTSPGGRRHHPVATPLLAADLVAALRACADRGGGARRVIGLASMGSRKGVVPVGNRAARGTTSPRLSLSPPHSVPPPLSSRRSGGEAPRRAGQAWGRSRSRAAASGISHPR